ncbi:hypothetical protein HanPSC8_Chr13g0550181 [Helianthus annuus]|nr:hypothetical protein HanPSC8_Chr13g0550181 [Helianthus annuus]
MCFPTTLKHKWIFDQKGLSIFFYGNLAHLGCGKGIFVIIFKIQNLIIIKIRRMVIIMRKCDLRILRFICFLLLMLIKHLL